MDMSWLGEFEEIDGEGESKVKNLIRGLELYNHVCKKMIIKLMACKSEKVKYRWFREEIAKTIEEEGHLFLGGYNV